MSTHTVTRCPQCGTSFRITPAQLQSARGAVRCGSCLHIFRAQDHLITPGADASAPATGSQNTRKTAGKTTPAGKVTPTSTGKSNTGTSRSAPSTPERPAANTAAKRASSKSTLTQSAAPKPEVKPADYPSPARYAPAGTPPRTPPQQTGLNLEPPASSEPDGDLDDDFLISDDMDQPPASAYGEGLSDDFLKVSSPGGTRISLFDREIRETEQEIKDSADESWAMSLLDDDEPPSVEIKPSQPGHEDEGIFQLIETQAARARAEAEDEEHLIQTEVPEEEPEEEEPDSYAAGQLYAHNPARSALLMNIDPEPVELSWQQTGSNRRQWLWAGLSALALVLLVTQVAWLQFERLSRLQPYRNIYASICPLLGCQLPDLVDRSQISAAHLIVRTHPTQAETLEVNLMLLNNAPFEQPFPELVLEFSDLQERTVALRRFTPAEYLGGELTGQRLMPRNQPVRLTLELAHPGADAVNYRAYIPH